LLGRFGSEGGGVLTCISDGEERPGRGNDRAVSGHVKTSAETCSAWRMMQKDETDVKLTAGRPA